ncbi:MAG: cohesin domain-containing protein, partial [Candidatus Desantisbacteria bacterium]
MKNFIKQNIIIIIIFLAANAYSAALEITPDSVNITSMQPFTMDITVKDAVDLYGAGFDVTFDTGLIRVVEVREGTFLRDGATQTSFLKQIDNQQGRVVMGITRLGSIPGVNGSGTLATVVFKPISTGTATLKLQGCQIKDSHLDTIPTTVTDSLINIKLLPITLQIIPAITDVLSNQTFTVTISAKDAVDLYGASLDLIFDTDKLSVIEAKEGGFLKQATISTSFLNKIDNEQGKVIMGMSRLGQVSGVTGTGNLVAITMKAKSAGTATLKLTNMVMQDSAFDALEVAASSTSTAINILPAILKLQPETIDALTNQDVTVKVMVDKVAGLYGASFDILFDPSLLRGINITEGNFLSQDGLQTSFLRTIDNKNGKVIIGISRLEKVKGISGSGTLCSITFKTMGQGITTLGFDNLSLKDTEFDSLSLSVNESKVKIIPIKLKFNPQLQEVKLGRDCEVDIVAEGVNNLFGAGFDMVFNSDILEAATVTEGNFLNQDSKPTGFMKIVDNGRIVIGMTRMGQDYGVSGTGVLCTIIFTAKT